MKKILIIGIDSFTGGHLKTYLSNRNLQVYGTVLEGSGKNIYQCDITKKNEIKDILKKIKPEYIINLAGISFVGFKDKEIFYKVNVLAVENILESILELSNYNPEKIILVSSATVYGNQEKEILNENLFPNPINHYGISKFSMEQIAKTYFDKLNILITRPFNYTGIGQEKSFLIPKIVQHFKERKREIELGNIDVFREFNDIYFVCEAYTRLLETNISSEIINIASNRLISLTEVIEMMNSIAGFKIAIKINEEFVRKNEIKKLGGSNEKLFNSVGFIEQKKFKETLLEIFEAKN